VPVSDRGSVLNPLHPVSKIAGLKRGQHWRIPLVDPLSDSLKAMARADPALQTLVKQDSGLRTLQAEVLSETQTMAWGDGQETCLVIEYRDGDMSAQTWVREGDGTVLRQVATLWGEKLLMERDPPPASTGNKAPENPHD
jgi:hypothetical protein